MRSSMAMRTRWLSVARVIGAVGMVLALSGCVVVPAYYPRYHYYHPYRYY
jgi:hypothetical protein